MGRTSITTDVPKIHEMLMIGVGAGYLSNILANHSFIIGLIKSI